MKITWHDSTVLWRIVRGLFWTLLSLGVASFINFILIQYAPVKPDDFFASQEILTTAQYDQEPALKQSLFQGYGHFLTRIFTGDFGRSQLYDVPVIDVIQDALIVSLTLSSLSLLLSYGGAFLIAWIYFISGSMGKKFLYGALSVLQSLPKLFVALLLVIVFASNQDSGLFPLESPPLINDLHLDRWDLFWNASQKFILPTLTLFFAYTPKVFLYFVGMMAVDSRLQNHLFWRGHGRSKNQIFWLSESRYLLSTLLWRVVNDFVFLIFTYGFMVEIIFSLPGMGFLGYRAIISGDFDLFMVIFLLFSVISVAFNFILRALVPTYEQVKL